MIGNGVGGSHHLLDGQRFHSLHVRCGGHSHAGEGGGGIVAFDGTGGIVGGTEAGADGGLGGGQLLGGDFTLFAQLQLMEDFCPGGILLVKVDARTHGDDALGSEEPTL